MKKTLAIATTALGLACAPLMAAEPDGLVLPPGFHAKVVAEGLGPAVRHLVVRDNGDIYVSTRHGRNAASTGIIALRLGPDHTVVQTEHFSTIDQGTGIRIYKGALYATTSTTVYRIPLDPKALVPTAEPEVIVDGLAVTGNHAIAFDGKGGLYVSTDGGGNICAAPRKTSSEKPVGLKPCPNLETKGGIWRFNDSKPGQKFAEGELYATGLRDSSSVEWRQGDALYVASHGRDATHNTFPDLISQEQDDAIPDDMYRVVKGTDMGWPYTYYDGVRKMRILAPEYGGDGKTAPKDGNYAEPVAYFLPSRSGVLDVAFYSAKKFPSKYRGGAFVALHGGADSDPGAKGQPGYNVMFLPFKSNKAGTPEVFADNFAGPLPTDRNQKIAAYRPVGLAVAPDGSLYIADSNKGRIWRVTYGDSSK